MHTQEAETWQQQLGNTLTVDYQSEAQDTAAEDGGEQVPQEEPGQEQPSEHPSGEDQRQQTDRNPDAEGTPHLMSIHRENGGGQASLPMTSMDNRPRDKCV